MQRKTPADIPTRSGINALREQLFAKALRQGLGKAAEVLVVADGAVWIWNLVKDRLGRARQRVGLFHAKERLWAVAHATVTPQIIETRLKSKRIGSLRFTKW